MNRVLTASALLAAALAIAAVAGDLTGTWKGRLPPTDGTVREMTFRFKQSGSQLTGAFVGGREETPISEGKVTAGKFSFALVGPRGKMICNGTVSGDEMKMIQYRDGTRELTRELILKRQ